MIKTKALITHSPLGVRLKDGAYSTIIIAHMLYLPTLTPAGWKLRSHAGSGLQVNFSRLIEKCELLPSCLTQFPKIMLIQTHERNENHV